jgi:FkbM family methyltransferase
MEQESKLQENNNPRQYFSHYGEDAILDYIFKDQQDGFYVDIGCYHPDIFPNTKKLFLQGWKGINIDANKDTIDLFNKYRPNDINLNYAISENEGEGEYFKFLEFDSSGGGSGNSLSTEVKEAYEKQGLTAKTIKVKIKPLYQILDQYAPNQKIDFMNIDVEGFDLNVLKSNNWYTHRPKIVAVEIWNSNIDIDNTKNNEIYQYLRNKNYKAFSCAIHTWFFYDMNSNLIFE